MNISVVIPLFNEEESLPELMRWIDQVMKVNAYSYQVIMIDDGSEDESWKVIENLSQEYGTVRGIRFTRNYGKSAALNEGFAIAEGEVVITMDADLQDSPEEIPELYRMITVQGYHLVSGWKQKRYDPLSKTIPTRLFNWATRKMSGIYLHDFNCGLKSYALPVVQSIEVYGEMHRYIPILAKDAGFKRITEKVVSHQARKYGKSKFGLNRFVNGLLDLMSISFMIRFGKKPMHFFGLLGLLSTFTGLAATIWLIVYKLININNPHARDITDKPSFYIALTMMIIGVQMFLAGFIGEMIGRNSSERNVYKIRERI
ncbi:MAG: glycosyltransferase family 2 protein [Bacteroidota bacterium]|nr:glycosyltransferase family 2 protein [Bacteroidota bacterium]